MNFNVILLLKTKQNIILNQIFFTVINAVKSFLFSHKNNHQKIINFKEIKVKQ